jgi:hypothetical protein
LPETPRGAVTAVEKAEYAEITEELWAGIVDLRRAIAGVRATATATGLSRLRDRDRGVVRQGVLRVMGMELVMAIIIMQLTAMEITRMLL